MTTPEDFRASSLSSSVLPVGPDQTAANENEPETDLMGETAVVLLLAALANAIKMGRRKP